MAQQREGPQEEIKREDDEEEKKGDNLADREKYCDQFVGL